jgi:hypothetical protein
MSERSKAALKTNRPILPNPLIPILIVLFAFTTGKSSDGTSKKDIFGETQNLLLRSCFVDLLLLFARLFLIEETADDPRKQAEESSDLLVVIVDIFIIVSLCVICVCKKR